MDLDYFDAMLLIEDLDYFDKYYKIDKNTDKSEQKKNRTSNQNCDTIYSFFRKLYENLSLDSLNTLEKNDKHDLKEVR